MTFSVKIFFLLFVAVSVVNSQNYDVDPVAKFTFNNGMAIDEISNTKIKTASILYTSDRFGNEKSACYLHGSQGSYLNLGTGKTLKPTKGTISLWVNINYPTENGVGYLMNPIILTKNRNGDDFYEGYTMAYYIQSKKIGVATSLSEKNQVNLSSSDSILLNKWMHLVMTYDNQYLKFYINGNLEASIGKNFESEFSPTDSVMIGNSANKKNDRYLCGTVDDILIYNRVLNENEIKELYEQPNPNRVQIYLNWIKISFSIAFFFAILVWYFVRRYKKEMIKKEEWNQTRARLNELETKAIRMQMNPHFIFNSLNSLQRFILESDIEKAHEYLSRFSIILRKLLESSESESISLQEELEILDAYISIEKMRFGESFDYQINSEFTSQNKIFIPFMLIQPIVENAIWHGLLPKVGSKKLRISILQCDNERLVCEVEDNGVGRKDISNVNLSTNKKRSMATEFIRQRFANLKKVIGIEGKIIITDKKKSSGESDGTLVTLIIPILK